MLGGYGRGKNRGKIEGRRGNREGCSLCEAGQGNKRERGGSTLIYYSLDLQSTWKVSNPLPQAFNGNTTVSAGCIILPS